MAIAVDSLVVLQRITAVARVLDLATVLEEEREGARKVSLRSR